MLFASATDVSTLLTRPFGANKLSHSSRKGILNLKVTVKKWGNSAAVRIPAAAMETARLELDQVVDVRAEAGRVVIEPIKKKDYDIRKLVKRITRKNCHSLVDFGKPVGHEVW